MIRAMQRSAICRRSNALGMTLIELVIAIAVIAIAVSSVLAVFSAQATRSAEAMIREQASGIASAYLNEILQKSFANGPGSTRATYDGVQDYISPPSPVFDQWGNAVAGLGQFTVAVAVTQKAINGVPAVPANQAWLVDVTVTHPSGVSVLLSGYKTNHP